MTNPLKYFLALRFCDGIGNITARRLLSFYKDPEAIFSEKRTAFLSVPGASQRLYDALHKKVNWTAVERELEFMERTGTSWMTILDKHYPESLSLCHDAPFIFFHKGAVALEGRHTLSVVGTRSATEYGKAACEQLIGELAPYSPVIISGLAYGIDIAAHKKALELGLETIAVVAHGLNMVYPSSHKSYAEKISRQGALISEFCSTDKPDKENFPQRNRIIAGLAGATVVVEASVKGGALITARLAAGYNRDVFAFPGRTIDRYSSGCNLLIKNHEAVLIEAAADLVNALGWNTEKTIEKSKKALLPELTEDELSVIRLMEDLGSVPIDLFAARLDFSPAKTASLLLTLEMKGAIVSLPGKMYELC